jgi:GH24 family phage-related lysozyme (muramidase)
MFTPSAQLHADMRRWEGESLIAYRDSLGFWTQGVGRHHGITASSPSITSDIESQWLVEDIQTGYYDGLDLVPNMDSFDLVRKEALIALAFNMGKDTLSQFVPFLRYLQQRNWDEAAFHLLTNLSHRLTPYLIQTKARAVETALRICSGEVLEEFLVA